MRASKIILFVSIVIFFAHIVYYYPFLPEKMAIHFDAAGNADGWAPKSSFAVFEAILSIYLIGQSFFLTWFLEKLPNSLINIPNREYWLADERRAATFSILKHQFRWFSVALTALFIAVNQLIFQANLRNENIPASRLWIVIGLFILFTVVWLVGLMRKFRRTV